MTSGLRPAPAETTRISFPRMALLIVIFLVIAFVIPHPSSVKPSDWRFFSIFVATILGLMIEPIPGGALVLLGVTLAALVGGMTLPRALSGYSDSVVWLVLTS